LAAAATGSEFDGAALVVDGTAAAEQAAPSFSGAAASSLVPIMALAASATSTTVGAGAQRHAGFLRRRSGGHQIDSGADHGDVHFGARNEAQMASPERGGRLAS
jgi:hypothetical protein